MCLVASRYLQASSRVHVSRYSRVLTVMALDVFLRPSCWAGAGGRCEVHEAGTVPSCAAGHGRPAAVRLRPFCRVFHVSGPPPGGQGAGQRPAVPCPRGRARKDASRASLSSAFTVTVPRPRPAPQRWLLPSPCDSPERLCGCCSGAGPERGSHSRWGLRVNRPVCAFLPTPRVRSVRSLFPH